jgi:hypothetical protein
LGFDAIFGAHGILEERAHERRADPVGVEVEVLFDRKLIQLLSDRVEVGVEAIGICGNLLGERPQCFCDFLLVQPATLEVIGGAGIGEAPSVLLTVEQLEVEFVDK